VNKPASFIEVNKPTGSASIAGRKNRDVPIKPPY